MTLPEYTRTMVQVYASKIETELTETYAYSKGRLDTLFKEYGGWVDLHCSVSKLHSMIQQDIYDID